MKHLKKQLIVLLVVLTAAFSSTAQVGRTANAAFDITSDANFIFSNDSIQGFDEVQASAAALSSACYGNEYKVFMYKAKRKFIIEKYNIKVAQPKETIVFDMPLAKFSSMPSSGACNNDDFEDAQANGGPQVGGVVNGWSLFGSTAANYCSPFANSATTNYTVYNNVATDPIMVAPNNTIASYFDATSTAQPAGSCFIRLNNALAGAKVVRASKTYTVSASNAVFQYAYRAVISDPNHGCCDQPGFHIKVTITNTATSQSTVLACPNISVAAGSSCGPATPGFVTGNLLNGSPSSYHPNWVPGALDLSGYIGSAVTLDVYAIDCSFSGHAGYVYFDAQCSPMTILGNGQGFPAGTPNITLPTCGASGATITAPPGLGPYSWSSSAISIPANMSVPSNTNQVLVTNQSGTLQLTMNPPGSCNPINKIITVTITPAPVALATATQASCTNTLSAASLTTSGSASVSPVITWSPTPATVSSNSMNASGLAVGVTTIFVQDVSGCKTQATVNILSTPPPVTFAINPPGTLTCNNPTVIMNATSGYTFGTITYTWSSTSFTTTGNPISITSQGNYLVCGMDAATTCSSCQTFTVNQNITIPTNTVSPISQNITCGNGSAATFTSTATSPTVNIMHNWYSPQTTFPGPPSSSSNGTTSIYSVAGVLGTHTVEFCNTFNGCCNTKTISVTSTAGFPSFQTSSTTNYSLGCNPSSMTLCIVNVTSAINGPTNFAFLPPTSTLSAPIPTTAFSSQNCTTVSTPGTWYLVVQDVTNQCQTALPVYILQNTITPHVTHSVTPNTHTLTCFNPTLYAIGTSTSANTSVTWIIPSTPPALSSPTLILGPPTGPATSTTNLTYATYTAVATNSVNGCISTETVFVGQNFRRPNPLLTVGNPSVITCKQDPVVLNYTGSTGGSGILGAVATVSSWGGPAPQTTLTGVNTYSAYIPGMYTLTVQDNKNGCIGTATYNIIDQTQPPILVNPISTFTLDCGNGTGSSAQSASMQIALTTSISSWSILFTEYPAGSNFGPTAATGGSLIQQPNGLTSTGSSLSQIVTTDKSGVIEYRVLNKNTGCITTGTINVVNGGLTADFTASPLTGFAPLSVNFTNNSATSTGASSIISTWSFGNGSSATFTGNTSPSTVYNAPGTYTVLLFANKGDCVDSTYKVIKVEIPSKLEIPNVFTPNGDGSNDLFFLKVTGVSEINALIFDRWGNKVYEVDSSTGNIGWDGKNLQDKECPSGTYFYVIKATGKEFEQKGTVSLYR